jgi:hypothetical protein
MLKEKMPNRFRRLSADQIAKKLSKKNTPIKEVVREAVSLYTKCMRKEKEWIRFFEPYFEKGSTMMLFRPSPASLSNQTLRRPLLDRSA